MEDMWNDRGQEVVGMDAGKVYKERLFRECKPAHYTQNIPTAGPVLTLPLYTSFHTTLPSIQPVALRV